MPDLQDCGNIGTGTASATCHLNSNGARPMEMASPADNRQIRDVLVRLSKGILMQAVLDSQSATSDYRIEEIEDFVTDDWYKVLASFAFIEDGIEECDKKMNKLRGVILDNLDNCVVNKGGRPRKDAQDYADCRKESAKTYEEEEAEIGPLFENSDNEGLLI